MRHRDLRLRVEAHPERVASLLARGPGGAWLDPGPGGGFICWSPEGGCSGPAQPLSTLRAGLRPEDRRPLVAGRRRFCSGLVGWLSYESGRVAEDMPQPLDEGGLPELHLSRHEAALHLLGGDEWLATGREDLVEQAREALREAEGLGPPDPGPARARLVDAGDPPGFTAAVARALAHIACGDLYQVNLSRRLVVRGVDDPFSAFLRLRRAAPAPFGAWLSLPEGALLMNSPELFLDLSGGEVLSRPIKGTRPRGADPALDARLVEELLADPKERAELTMIVDLVRNDLGRVCVPGSVVAGPREVKAWPTLHHAEQPVGGRLRDGLDAFDLIGASFPPGSVTGAPKVMAMDRIRALEPAPRGVYTGALGWFADGGDARLAVCIRVAQVGGRGRPSDEARVHVGCGVVADSSPEAELFESEVKARALLRALTGGAA